jgi:hypothetical protein
MSALAATQLSLAVPGTTRPCETCGQSFEATRADAKYCSATCKQAAYRERRVTDNPQPSVTDKPIAVTDKPPPVDDSDDFNWREARENGAIVQEQAYETAVYVNPFGQVVIRQASWPDDDKWVVIAPANLWQLIAELQKLERQLDGRVLP